MKAIQLGKRLVLSLLAAGLLISAPGRTAYAHGHHQSGHHGNNRSGVYCSYHRKYHGTRSSCKKYCTYHKTTHRNGKKHHAGVYCPYHKK